MNYNELTFPCAASSGEGPCSSCMLLPLSQILLQPRCWVSAQPFAISASSSCVNIVIGVLKIQRHSWHWQDITARVLQAYFCRWGLLIMLQMEAQAYAWKAALKKGVRFIFWSGGGFTLFVPRQEHPNHKASSSAQLRNGQQK